MLKTFKRGTHPPASKFTEDMPLMDFSVPDVVAISLSQHIGTPATLLVKEGEHVRVGTKIGEASGFVSANIFSSVSGTVLGVTTLPTANGGKSQCVQIENDKKYETEFLKKLENPTKEQILARIKDAGIVGMGGATFPTHVKFSPNKPVDKLIVNGAECEPYITCDYRLMMEKGEEVLQGIEFMRIALGVEKAYVGIENNKKPAIEYLKEIAPPTIEIVPLKAKYPQGAEKQLIYSVTHRIVKTGTLPMDAGCVVANIHTAFSLKKAVIDGEPLFMRAMTVSGDGVEKRGNFFVRNGISYDYIYNELRGNVAEDVTKKVISGGPMMGFSVSDLSITTTKGSSSLLFLADKQINTSPTTQCINCGRCLKGCPMNLNPGGIETLVLHGDYERLKKMNVFSCIECGVCSYNCPAKRPLLSAIRLAKKNMKERGIK